MTSREIILANLAHDSPDRAGMTFWGDRMSDVCFGSPCGSGAPEQKRWIEGDREFYDDEWGNIWVRMCDGSAKGEIHQSALDDWDKLDDLEPPDYSNPGCYGPMKAGFDEAGDLFRMAHIGGWVFDNARYLRRLDNYLADMALEPEKIRRLNAIVAKLYETRIHGAGNAGADGIFIGEDLGTQTGTLFSPAMFREFFKSEYTRLLGIAHDYGMKVFLHSCGNNAELIDDLIDVGIDCFQFDQPAVYDMPALAEKFRSRKVALWSPVDIQQVLPTGDRAFIEAETERLVDTFRGGLILNRYPDLAGIGIKEEWNTWAYDKILEVMWNA